MLKLEYQGNKGSGRHVRNIEEDDAPRKCKTVKLQCNSFSHENDSKLMHRILTIFEALEFVLLDEIVLLFFCEERNRRYLRK